MQMTTSPVEADQMETLWQELRQAAMVTAAEEPALARLMHAAVLDHDRLADALGYVIASKLGDQQVTVAALIELCAETFAAEPEIVAHFVRDMRAVRERDPACHSYLQPFLFFKGTIALEAYRVTHSLWRQGREMLAFMIQSRISEEFQVDIHPAARLGAGLFVDHGTGIVIGETSVVGDDVSILQSVTLGGNGKERGDRHPKIRDGVLISVGAKVLGNITVGEGALIGAASVVLQDVPPHSTAAGIPARIVKVRPVPRQARPWIISLARGSDSPFENAQKAHFLAGTAPLPNSHRGSREEAVQEPARHRVRSV